MNKAALTLQPLSRSGGGRRHNNSHLYKMHHENKQQKQNEIILQWLQGQKFYRSVI